MHDPLVVAFEIRRPWPQKSSLPATGSRGDRVRWRIRHHHDHHADCPPGCSDNPFPWWKPRSYMSFWRLAGRDWYWPALITVWHREPGGADALSVCQRRVQGPDGKWHYRGHWRLHVHHWRIQLPPLQHLRRWALTRCAWCGGKSRKGDYVNVSHSWDGPRGHWWQGAPGLFHSDCSSVERAHALCYCGQPRLRDGSSYGHCQACGKFRPYGAPPGQGNRLLATLPPGARITPEFRPLVEAAWAADRAAREQESHR